MLGELLAGHAPRSLRRWSWWNVRAALRAIHQARYEQLQAMATMLGAGRGL
jgi:hypothetical protein